MDAGTVRTERADERTSRAEQEAAVGIGVDRHVRPDDGAHREDTSRIDQWVVADLDL